MAHPTRPGSAWIRGRSADQCLARRSDRDGLRCQPPHRPQFPGGQRSDHATGAGGHSAASQRRTTQQSLRGGRCDSTFHTTRTTARESHRKYPFICTVTTCAATASAPVNNWTNGRGLHPSDLTGGPGSEIEPIGCPPRRVCPDRGGGHRLGGTIRPPVTSTRHTASCGDRRDQAEGLRISPRPAPSGCSSTCCGRASRTRLAVPAEADPGRRGLRGRDAGRCLRRHGGRRLHRRRRPRRPGVAHLAGDRAGRAAHRRGRLPVDHRRASSGRARPPRALRRRLPAGRREVAQVARPGTQGRYGARRWCRRWRRRSSSWPRSTPEYMARRHLGDLLQLAHYRRLLEAAGSGGGGVQRRRDLRVRGRRRLVRPGCVLARCARARRWCAGGGPAERDGALRPGVRACGCRCPRRRRRTSSTRRWPCWPSRSCARSATCAAGGTGAATRLEEVADLSLVSGVGVARRRLYKAHGIDDLHGLAVLDWTTAELVRRGRGPG